MDLREPLLQESDSVGIEEMTTTTTTPTISDWPAEAAQRAKLYIPPEWPGEHDADATCVISYDTTKKVICIKDSQSQGQVLDVMDPRDIIGADLEIKFFGPTEALSHVGFRNAKARSEVLGVEDEDDVVAAASFSSSSVPKKDSVCNIFKPLEHNVDKIFSLQHACHAEEIPLDTQAMAILNIYVYPRKHPSQTTWGHWFGLTEFKPMPNPNPPEPMSHTQMGNRYAHHRRFEVVRSEDFADIRSLVRAIRSLSSHQSPHTKYLVFLNPVGGQKKAREIYDSLVVPMLEQASVDHDLVVTTRARHAEEYAMEADFDVYGGFIAMGGDGIIHEVLQGIRKRAGANQLLEKLKMGVIGCGTSNGLAASILHESEELYSPLESTFIICKGQTSFLDLSEYTAKEKTYTSFLTYSYGMIADIDIDSEVIRCLGTFRYDLWGAYLGMKLHSYPVRLSFLPPNSGAFEMPALTEAIPQSWTTLETDIVLLWASQVSHAGTHIQSSPPSRLQDGLFQILIVRRRGLSRYQMIKWLLSLDHHGSQMNCEITEMIQCVAWRLEPLSEGSYNNLDGEVVESGPIQGRVVPSAIQTFGKSVHQRQGGNPPIDNRASF